MGAFEDFVNANLGIRKPLITDTVEPSVSTKAAGIPGSQFLDSSTNFLYEKTGDNNALDWVKIGKLGESRVGSEISLDYISGATGEFDQFYALTGEFDQFYADTGVIDNTLSVGEDVIISGKSVSSDLINISGESTANFISLSDDVSTFSSDILSVSGESLANFLSISDDLSSFNQSLEIISGESTANFISLSDELYLTGQLLSTGSNSSSSELSQRIIDTGIALQSDINQVADTVNTIVASGSSIYGSYSVSPGHDEYEINFLNAGVNNLFTQTPHVVASLRSSASVIYGFQISSVYTTGFHVRFSDDIVDNGLFIDFIVNI